MDLRRYEGLDALRILSSFSIVFLHVWVAAGAPHSLDFLVKVRDFALPALAMSSFFLLVVSLRKPERDFAIFFRRRGQRLWLPLVVWTLIYSLIISFVFPVLFGFESFGELPSPVLFVTGYRHLWYLQFIFIGSLAIYPLVRWLSGKSERFQTKLSLVCFASAFLYGLLFYSVIKNYTDWDNFNPEADISLRIFVEQASGYILYIPVAVGFALISGKITDIFNRRVFRRLSLALVFIALAAHLGASGGVLLTREIYGVAAFLVALQPWRKIRSGFMRRLAAYSYGIYILHFLPAQALWTFVAHKNYEPGAAAVLGIAVVVYFASFVAVVLIRKLFPADWLLPLVAVSS